MTGQGAGEQQDVTARVEGEPDVTKDGTQLALVECAIGIGVNGIEAGGKFS